MLDRVTPEELDAQYELNDWERDPEYLVRAALAIRELQIRVAVLESQLEHQQIMHELELERIHFEAQE